MVLLKKGFDTFLEIRHPENMEMNTELYQTYGNEIQMKGLTFAVRKLSDSSNIYVKFTYIKPQMMGFTAEDNFAKTAENQIFYLNDTNINNLFPFSQKNIYYILRMYSITTEQNPQIIVFSFMQTHDGVFGRIAKNSIVLYCLFAVTVIHKSLSLKRIILKDLFYIN